MSKRKVCEMLTDAINDEMDAWYKEYPELKKELTKSGYKNESKRISKILEDEKSHYDELRKIRKKLCR